MKSNNSLTPPYFQFTVFADYGPLRYLFFSLSLLIYVTIISANLVIVLSVSTGFFPRFLMDLLSDTHFISRARCFTELYITSTHVGHEVSLLTVMAYDRFVAICQPLHYHSKMSFRTVLLLLTFAVLTPLCVFGYFLYLASNLPLCGNELHRIFCAAFSVVQLSCVDTTVISIAGQFLAVISVFIPLSFVLYTYLCILLVCRRSSSEFRGKALQTCLPHIVTFINFCISVLCEVSLSQYTTDAEKPVVIVVLSLEFSIIPPISNPLVYALNLPKIRGVIFGFLRAEHLVHSTLFKDSAGTERS
uniref:G-protein coupled receptors family 1 profile domain-containing protein n=1 Tax=Monopterus albus TaxID=43700 RepID=A0A3Q3IES9_MONAL